MAQPHDSLIKPGDISVEQPVKFELMVDLKTMLGLEIPATLLARTAAHDQRRSTGYEPGGALVHRELLAAGCITFFTTYSPI
jgi:hypothetical protein